jgi:hypothetical protein
MKAEGKGIGGLTVGTILNIIFPLLLLILSWIKQSKGKKDDSA